MEKESHSRRFSGRKIRSQGRKVRIYWMYKKNIAILRIFVAASVQALEKTDYMGVKFSESSLRSEEGEFRKNFKFGGNFN